MVRNGTFASEIRQNPIGKSSRSNPVTYLKAFDEISKLYAAQPLAKQMDFSPAYFSFNVEGGRCEEFSAIGKGATENFAPSTNFDP